MNKLKLTDIRFPLKRKISKGMSYSPRDLFERKWYKVDYDVILSNGKSLQRAFCWTNDQKNELILSILKGIALPNFTILSYEEDDISRTKIFKIIDGKQRLSTIESFMNNEFPLIIKSSEFYYRNLDEDAQREIWNLNLSVDIAYSYYDDYPTDDELIRWFELINFAGTPQDKEHLKYLKND